MEIDILKNVWRYCFDPFEAAKKGGGIVIADTFESAKLKLKKVYGDELFLVWNILDDDFF